jgi:asparagine synthase (glutamine-hydrolysing)
VETRSVEEMVEGVRERLTEAIRLRLKADVPIGIYLSGGIDSSLVAGIVTHLVKDEGIKMGNQDATSRICCFSIQFPDQGGFDESGNRLLLSPPQKQPLMRNSQTWPRGPPTG